jgi:hypothetical protein
MEDADWFARRGLECARRFGQREVESIGLHLIADLEASGGLDKLDTRAEAYGHALDLAEELGLRPMVAHCKLGLGQVARRRGDRPEAQHHLQTALSMYAEMGMECWRVRAEHERGALR